jgi:hypothetical protein
MIARLNGGNTIANCFNNASTLVAVDRRQCSAPMTIGIRNVAMANCNCRKFYFHFTRASFSKSYLLDYEGLSKFATDGCFHDHDFLLLLGFS